MLFGRNNEYRSLSIRPAFRLPFCFQIGVSENGFPISRCHIECRDGRNFLLHDDVPDPPPATFPGIRKRRLGLVLGQSPARTAQLIRMDKQGSREACTGRLREHSGDIVKRSDPVKSEVTPTRVHGCVYDSCDARFLLFVGNMSPIPAHFPPDKRVSGRTNGLGVRRHIEPRAVGTHLVMVDVSLGHPLAEHELRAIDRFDGVSLECIPIVVVTDILVIEPRERDAFILRSHIFVIPIGDHDFTVRIKTRNHDRNRIVQDAHHFVVGPGHHVVGEFGRHLARCDFRGMQTHRLHNDRSTVGNGALDLQIRISTGITENGIDLL